MAVNRTPLARSRRRRKVRIPPGVRDRAKRRSHGVCVLCLHRAGLRLDDLTDARLRKLIRDGVLGAAVQLHHVLPEGKWPEFATLADNLIGLCPECHYAHEYPGVNNTRIPRAALPECALALAEREGLTWFIERTYRQTGGSE